MKEIINSVQKAITNKNWYAALFVSLTLPDICGKIEDPNKNLPNRYVEWFKQYMPQYQGFLSGEDCYALRCALLHEGKDDISEQKKQVLEHFVFLTSGSHRNLVGGKDPFLQLNVQKFCEEICAGVQSWMANITSNADALVRLNQTIEIHEPGYTYKGVGFG